ncbi:MAG: FAD-dependent oxidoreductase [Anaerolineales bacterium]|nr:FAD-dependent oxidoreductase [Anaerolineales bacterium]
MRSDVIVIGGGVIGVCAAFYLAQRGASVTLLERGQIGAGCSYGNAGLVVPGHSIPLAEPGALRHGLRWLLDPESPLYIRPRADRELAEWLLRFALACTEAHVRAAIPVLRDLGLASRALYDELAQLGFDFGYERRGLLEVFITRRGLAEAEAQAALLGEFGVEVRMLDGAGVRALEPNVSEAVLGGLYFPLDAHLDPTRFVRGLAQEAAKRGACIRTGVGVIGFEAEGRRITRVRTTSGELTPGQVVLAGGAWSPVIARDLQLKLPVQAAKGYSLTVKRPARSPAMPLLLGEAWVAVTPLGEALRFAGTLELAGLDYTINRRRLEAVRRGARAYLPETEAAEVLEAWRGLRPCTPDGLPIIGRAARYENLLLATGHAMLGISLGPVTGQLVAQLACGEKPALDLTPLHAERFA